MRRQVFEQVETTLALDTHDTLENGEESSDTRLDKWRNDSWIRN